MEEDFSKKKIEEQASKNRKLKTMKKWKKNHQKILNGRKYFGRMQKMIIPLKNYNGREVIVEYKIKDVSKKENGRKVFPKEKMEEFFSKQIMVEFFTKNIM